MIPLRRAYREPPQGLQVLDHRSPFANACLFAVCCNAGMLPPDVVSMRRPTLNGSSIKDWVRQGGRGLDFQASTGFNYAIPGVFSRQELTLLAWMARSGSRAGYMAALRLERSANDSLGLFQLGRSSSHVPQAWIGGNSGYASVTGTTTIGADVPFLAGATFDGSTVKVQHNAKQEGSAAAARSLSGLDFIRLSRSAEPAHATIFMAAVLEGVFQDDDQLAFLEAPFNLFRPHSPVFHSFAVPARDVALDGSLAATSAAAADLAIARALNGSVSSQSTAAGALALGRGLAASLVASAALSGALVRAESLAGTIAATSAIAGDAGVARQLAASPAGSSSANGSMGISRALDAALAELSALSADLGTGNGFAAALVAVSALSGEITVARALASAATGVSSAAGALDVVRDIAGDLASVSAIAAGLATARTLVSGSAALSTAAADVVVARRLVAALAAASASSAHASCDRQLAALFAGASVLSGTLTLPSPGDPIAIGPPWSRPGAPAPRMSSPPAAARSRGTTAKGRAPGAPAAPRR